MSCGIYKLKSPSGKRYIGQSISIRKRFSKYKRLDCKDQPKLYNALKKYGANNFSYEIIEICSIDALDVKEKYYIKKYDSIKNGYNCKDGGTSQSLRTPFRKNSQSMEFYIDNILYHSIKEASIKLNIPHKTIHNRLNSVNVRYSNYCYKDKGRIPQRRNRITHNVEFYIDGILYQSLEQASKSTGIPKATIRNRLRSKTTLFSNYYYQDKSRNQPRHTSPIRKVKINDVIYPSISAAARALQVPRKTIERNYLSIPQFPL